jgi:hypothetical protein
MAQFSDPLSRVRVASPCTADWDSMIGDERVRFCGQCELNVYNLSALTRTQAENLIGGTERRLCVRFYRRRDGSIITQNCPVGLRALKLRLSRIRKAVAAALFGFFAGAGGTLAVHRVEHSQMTMGTIAEPVRPPNPPVVVGELISEEPVTMGRAMIVRRRPRRH